MKTYKLYKLESGDILLHNDSPMYPSGFEKKINSLAGETITKSAPPVGGFFGNFINTFVILSDKLQIFEQKVIPNIGWHNQESCTEIWDKDEETEANLI